MVPWDEPQVTPVSLGLIGFGARGFFSLLPKPIKVSISPLVSLFSPDAGRELGMVEQGKFFLMGNKS